MSRLVGAEQGGRTLIEIMIASSLLLMLTGACALALRASMDYSRRVQEQSLMENELLASLGLLSKELTESRADSVHWDPVPAALTFPIPRGSSGALLVDHSDGNKLKFQTVLSYRVEGSDNDLRRYIDVLPTAQDTAPHPIDHLVPPRDSVFYSSSLRENRRLASGVTSFVVEGYDINDDTAAETLTSDFHRVDYFNIVLRLERRLRRRYAVSVELKIAPSN